MMKPFLFFQEANDVFTGAKLEFQLHTNFDQFEISAKTQKLVTKNLYPATFEELLK